MKKRMWVTFFIAGLMFGCGGDTGSDQVQSEQVQVEKDRIDNVSDAASTIGYEGEAIEKGLRDVEKRAQEQNKTMEEIFDE